jgi:hypothetical protein
MPNGMSERSVLIEHCGVGGSARKDTLYPIGSKLAGTPAVAWEEMAIQLSALRPIVTRSFPP